MSAPTQPTTNPSPTTPWPNPPQVPSKPGPMGPTPRVYPTPARLALLADVAQERIRRGYAGDQTDVGHDSHTRTGRKVSAQITELAAAGWVELSPTLFSTGTRGFLVRYWQPTHLGRGFRAVRLMNYGQRMVAEIGEEGDPTVIGTADMYQGNKGLWLVKVGADQAITRGGRTKAVVDLWYRAAAAAADLLDGVKPATPVYRVEFERIGRNHNVAPLVVTADSADDLAETVYRYAREYLISRDVDVNLSLDLGKGTIFCGFQIGGSFTITAVKP